MRLLDYWKGDLMSNMSMRLLDKNSSVGIELVKKLRDYRDNKDYVRGVLVYTNNEEDAKRLIEFIDAGNNVDYETIYVYAMELADIRKSKEK